MKTIAEIEENPIEFVEWAKAQIAAEHGYDLVKMHEAHKLAEARLRAQGRTFVDFSSSASGQASIEHDDHSVLREDPPNP